MKLIKVYGFELPAKWEICVSCEGHGTCDPKGFSDGFTAEEMNEDPDFREDYFSGRYDVKCDECNGSGKVLGIDFELIKDEETLKALEKAEQEASQDHWDEYYEKRMGC